MDCGSVRRGFDPYYWESFFFFLSVSPPTPFFFLHTSSLPCPYSFAPLFSSSLGVAFLIVMVSVTLAFPLVCFVGLPPRPTIKKTKRRTLQALSRWPWPLGPRCMPEMEKRAQGRCWPHGAPPLATSLRWSSRGGHGRGSDRGDGDRFRGLWRQGPPLRRPYRLLGVCGPPRTRGAASPPVAASNNTTQTRASEVVGRRGHAGAGHIPLLHPSSHAISLPPPPPLSLPPQQPT